MTNPDVLKAKLETIRARVPVVRGRGEEATKQALVLPMLDALGYDIWNPIEVAPEYDADFATRKGAQKERVDLAVLLEGKPRIFIEVKSADTALEGHHGQLSRYFNASQDVALAVLTNGVEYWFYTDTAEPNILDAKPFHMTSLDAPDAGVDVLVRFHRGAFSPSAVRDYASDLIYTDKLTSFLRAQLDLRGKPVSEDLVRWVLSTSATYEGRLVANVVTRFEPLVRTALQSVLRDIVRRSVYALDQGVNAPEETPPVEPPAPAPAPSASTPSEEGEEKGRSRGSIVTTEAELRAYQIIEGQFKAAGLGSLTVLDTSSRKRVPVELGYKDTTAYFGVYLNKPAYWVMRLFLDSTNPWIGFQLELSEIQPMIPAGFATQGEHAHAKSRVMIKGVEDIQALSTVIIHAMRQNIASRAG